MLKQRLAERKRKAIHRNTSATRSDAAISDDESI